MIKQFFKKVLISYLIIICCIFTPTYNAYAASPAGWAFNSFNVATSVVTALKNGASASVAVAKSPISQKIAKGIVGGAIAGAAIPLAISQLSGIALEAVDWVLDPANNTIKYRSKEPPPTGLYWVSSGMGVDDYAQYAAKTIEQACINIAPLYKVTFVSYKLNSQGNFAYCNYAPYKYYDAVKQITYTPQNDYKTIPIPTVADKIYDNAKTDSNSRSVVNDAVKEYVNEGSADVALDNAKADTDATHNCGTGTHWNGSACVADTPSTPSTPSTPTTPFDPSSILDAIASLFDAVMSIPDVINTAIDKVLDAIASITDVINLAIDKVIDAITNMIKPLVDLLTSFINWFKDKFTALYDAITDFFQWVKTTYDDFVKPGDNEPTELDIPNNLPTPTDTNIRFGGMCPPNAEINVRIPFATINATLFDWSKWCYNLDTFVKPVIILLAAYFSVLIFRGKNESS